MKTKKEITTSDVVDAFMNFLAMYNCWRKNNGLTKNIDNVFEIYTGMTDKNGRIGRYIKHQERKDPKPDWPIGMAEAMMGSIIYMNMLLCRYGDDIDIEDIRQGFINELSAAINQHKK
jgi:hypothetical protein